MNTRLHKNFTPKRKNVLVSFLKHFSLLTKGVPGP